MQLNKKIFDYNNGDKKFHDFRLSQDKDFLYYDSKYMKKPNISSHTLVDFIGKNKYTSVGFAIMKTFGLVKKKPFDPYQGYKGGIAEEFAKKHLMKKYGAAADIEAFTLSQFKNMNQFPEAAPFSGVLDLMIHKPVRIPVEVKSKEMKDYEWIALKHQHPQDQLVQGANQAMLIGSDEYMMMWVFISKSTSELLRSITDEDLWIWEEDYRQAIVDLGLTEDDYKIYSKIFPLDPRMIGAYRERALKRYNDFYKDGKIPRKFFTKDEWNELKFTITKRSRLNERNKR